MARRQILSQSERESLLALPDDELTLTRMTYFSEQDLAIINVHRKPASRFGFAVLLCYLKSIGFAPWICPYISRHLLSLNPLQARCRRYSRGKR